MRLMSYIRKHAKTGIFWYRRSVPEALRPHLSVVPGFAVARGIWTPILDAIAALRPLPPARC
jgi:hypothetical protein